MELDDSERALHDSLSRWLADRIDPALQARADRPPVAPPWRELATDLGLLGAGLPERVGGLGGGLRAQRVVLQALGAALAAGAYTAGVLGGAALLAAGTAEADALLAQLIAGEVRVAWAPRCAAARATDTTPRCSLRRDGAQWRLDGRKSGVEGAPWASHLLVAVLDTDGPAVAWVDAGAAGLARRDLRQLDGGAASEVVFDGVRLPLAARLGGADLLERLHDLHTLAGCTEALALLRRLLADTTEHLRTRRQFGQALAGFQVLQHRLADMHIATVQAEALTDAVAEGFEGAPPDRRGAAVASAALAVGRACRLAAESAVQLHGAMGVTEELVAARVARRLLQIGLDTAHREWHLRRLDALLHGATA